MHILCIDPPPSPFRAERPANEKDPVQDIGDEHGQQKARDPTEGSTQETLHSSILKVAISNDMAREDEEDEDSHGPTSQQGSPVDSAVEAEVEVV
mmetsp:Transcript_53692/g.98122  ORF Transcript_53692/g.98122 Transcript_53692/m.98122 type:complete len:95 (+) Transcript_53692:779-1063(+)